MAKWKNANNYNGGSYRKELMLPPGEFGHVKLKVFKSCPWVRGGWVFEV